MRKALPILIVLTLLCLIFGGAAHAVKVYVNPSIQTNNVSPDGTYNEGYSMQTVADKLVTKLSNRGFSTRDSNWLSLSGACSDSVSWDADAFVALHTNAGGGGWSSAHGTAGYYYTSSGGWYDSLDRSFTDLCVHKCVSKFSAWGRGYDRGTFGDYPSMGYNFYVLSHTPGMHSTLVEGLFHTNQEDTAVLKTDSGKEAYAAAIFEAVCDFYGWSYGTDTWNSAYNAQSYKASMVPGEQAICWVEYKNTGNTTWSNSGSNPVRLGTSNPQDRVSPFFTSGNWVNNTRPTNMDSATCAPNEVERFTFIMTAPSTAGNYTEYWRLVSEGKTWFGYSGVYFAINVSNPKGDLVGKITDAGTGTALNGATVTLNTGASDTTDSAGNYSFTGLNPGTYTVTASMANYSDASGTAAVTAGTSTTRNLALTRQTGNLVGDILDSMTGTRISGATVTLSTGASTTTDASGHYSFTGLNAGQSYTATASKAGYVSKSAAKTISAGIDNWNSIALLPDKGNIHGTVTNAANGMALSGAKVALNTGASTTTDASGHYAFDNLASGRYNVAASAPGFQNAAATATVVAGATTTTNFALDVAPGTITGTITESGPGAAIAGATVTLNTGQSTTTDSSGIYTLTGIAPGTYTVTASAAGYSNASADAIVTSGATTTTNIALAPARGNISGKVSDSGTGNGISGATVSLNTGESTTTDASGNYAFNNLAVGAYTVSASAANYVDGSASATVSNGATATANIALNPQVGNLVGLITDKDTGAKLVGATCTIEGVGSAQTNTAGKYTFSNLRAGQSYTVTASYSGYVSASKSRIISAGIDNWNSIALIQDKGGITGTITDAVSQAPVSGATVSLNTGASTTTDASGNFAFANLPSGEYTVSASAANYHSGSDASSVVAGQTSTTNIALAPTLGSISGVIVGNPGPAIAGATVALDSGQSATTDANGAFSFSSVPEGDRAITVTASGFESKTETVSVVGGYNAEVNIGLVPATLGNIGGTITASDNGEAIAGATVSLNTGQSATTDEDGTYSFAELEPGAYTVSVSHSSYSTASGSATVAAGITTTTNLTMVPLPGSITGRITDSTTGAGISGATVSIPGKSATTDTSGNYTLSGVIRGSYTVSASAGYYTGNGASATVSANAATSCNIALVRQLGNLVGVIKNSVTGVAITGATCSIPGVGSVTTTSSGKYTFNNLRAGDSYTVTASCTGYFSNSSSHAVQAGIDTWNSFNLTPHATVTGTVTSSAGGAVSGATVTINGISATTNASGVFTVGGLAAGTFTMAVTQSSHLDWSGQVTTTAGSATTQNVTMTKVADVILDNTAGAFSCSATWSTGTYTGYYGTNYRWITTNATTDDRATWSLSLPKAGSYAVYAWWSAGTNRSTAANYYVNYSGGSTSVAKNQQSNGGSWQLLGTWNFATSGNSIQLSRIGTTGYIVVADAVKLVKQ